MDDSKFAELVAGMDAIRSCSGGCREEISLAWDQRNYYRNLCDKKNDEVNDLVDKYDSIAMRNEKLERVAELAKYFSPPSWLMDDDPRLNPDRVALRTVLRELGMVPK